MKIIKFIGEQALTGTYIRNNYGFVAVFSTGCATILLAIIFVIFILKESISQDTRERDDKALHFKGFIANFINQNLMRISHCLVDCCRDLLNLTLSGFKTIFKNRAEGSRKWVICFTLVFCLSSAIDSGASSVNYLFYRLQYGVDNTDMANLNNMYNWLMFVSQV